MNIEIDELNAFMDESPSHYADRLGIYYTSTVSEEHKKKLGQFFCLTVRIPSKKSLLKF